MFYSCSSLTSINLTTINTYSVKNMDNMFYNCKALLSLDLSNFDTSSAQNMSFMFYSCSSLTSLDLNNFNTKSVLSMSKMFYSCTSLKSLIIDNFDTTSVSDMNYMFYNCKALIYVNLSNFVFNTDQYSNIFGSCSRSLKICLDNRKIYSNYLLNYLSGSFKLNCTDICVNIKSKKFIIEENMCVDDCLLTKKYKYDYNNICHRKCPFDPDLCQLYNEMANIEEEYYLDSTIAKVKDSTNNEIIKIIEVNTDRNEENPIYNTNNIIYQRVDNTNERQYFPIDNTKTSLEKDSSKVKNMINDNDKIDDDNSGKNNKPKIIISLLLFLVL